MDENSGVTCTDVVGGADMDISNVFYPWVVGYEDYGVWFSDVGTETGCGECGDIIAWSNGEPKTMIFVLNPAIGGGSLYKNVVVRKKVDGVRECNWAIRRDVATDDELVFFYRNSADTAWHVYQTSDMNIPMDNFTFIVLTYIMGTGTSMQIYKNNGATVSGTWITEDGNEPPIVVAGQEVIVGATDKIGTQPQRGFTSELRVYNQILTVGEIQAIYSSLALRYGW